MVVIEALDLGQGMDSMKAPNRVSVELWDGTICALDAIRLTDTPESPLPEAEHRAKFKANVRGWLDVSTGIETRVFLGGTRKPGTDHACSACPRFFPISDFLSVQAHTVEHGTLW